MFIHYMLKLRLERYKQEKIESLRLEKELQQFSKLPKEKQIKEVIKIEVKFYKRVASVARSKLTLSQQIAQKESMKRYRAKRKKKLELEKKQNPYFYQYPARNPVKIMKIKIKGEDF